MSGISVVGCKLMYAGRTSRYVLSVESFFLKKNNLFKMLRLKINTLMMEVHGGLIWFILMDGDDMIPSGHGLCCTCDSKMWVYLNFCRC